MVARHSTSFIIGRMTLRMNILVRRMAPGNGSSGRRPVLVWDGPEAGKPQNG